jgi:hypothetical protein
VVHSPTDGWMRSSGQKWSGTSRQSVGKEKIQAASNDAA